MIGQTMDEHSKIRHRLWYWLCVSMKQEPLQFRSVCSLPQECQLRAELVDVLIVLHSDYLRAERVGLDPSSIHRGSN